jgi:transposase
VELYGQVRRAVYVEGLSWREAARRFGIDPRTVAKNGVHRREAHRWLRGRIARFLSIARLGSVCAKIASG